MNHSPSVSNLINEVLNITAAIGRKFGYVYQEWGVGHFFCFARTARRTTGTKEFSMRSGH